MNCELKPTKLLYAYLHLGKFLKMVNMHSILMGQHSFEKKPILLLSDTPNVLLPDSSVCKATQAKWLLEICEEHVKKFIFNADELNALVDQTKELQEAHKQEGKWRCRAEGCMATYVYHSSRVR